MYLVETIGVGALVALLVTMMTPAVLDTINDARLAALAMSINNLQTATVGYFREHGKFGLVNGAPVTWSNNAYDYWDRQVLIPEQLVERMVSSALATDCYVRLVRANQNEHGDVITYGDLGHLGHILCNNAIYDLTQEYSAHRRNGGDGLFYACARPSAGPARSGAGGSGGPSFPWLARASGLEWHGSGAFLGRLAPRAGFLARAYARLLAAVTGSGLGPLQGCYAADFPAPPPGIGTGPGGSGPSGAHSTRPAANNDAADGSIVAEMVLEGMSLNDAYRLSLLLDGRMQSNWAYWDSVGRVKYDFVRARTGTVFIYLAHK